MFPISRRVQSILVNLLSFGLLSTPLFALPVTPTNIVLPPPKLLPAALLKAAHKPAELLVKFKDSAPASLSQQVRTSWSTEPSQPLPGRSGIERLTLKPGLTVAQAVADLQQLTAVVEWVEPNYLVQVETRGERERGGKRDGGIGGKRAVRSTNRPLSPSLPRPIAPAPLVAVIDTGIAAAHPRLRTHLAGGWNVLNDTAAVGDDNGHGTNMAGIITRVHPQARLLPLKALDAEGIGAISSVIAAMDRAVAVHAAVILYSFGTEGKSQALLEAIQRAEMAGVVVVTAAGNDGQDLARVPQYPAAFQVPNLLTVAAVNQQQALADFSNYGVLAQVAAPGVDVRTTTRPNRFTRISGTSASAAYVAGVASRLKAVRPWVSATTIKQSIIRGARKLPALDGKVSAGLVDAKAALLALQDPQPSVQDEPKPEKTPVNKRLEERKKNFQTRQWRRAPEYPELPVPVPDLDTTRATRPTRRPRQDQCAPAGRL